MDMGDIRKIIARRAAAEISDGMIVNLGIGIPSLIPEFIPSTVNVYFQAENGILGMGPEPTENRDGNLSNAAGYPVSVLPGASYFDSAVSFGMIRSGYIDLSILGALEVSGNGDLANWIVPGKKVPGVGGAMELAYGAKNLIALMPHCDKSGRPKIVRNCSLPITTYHCVNKIITERAVFSISNNENLQLEEIMAGYNLEDIKNYTEADFTISQELITSKEA
jgi:acetate CoA/acetoacetate CoA-transferase beta subunit